MKKQVHKAMKVQSVLALGPVKLRQALTAVWRHQREGVREGGSVPAVWPILLKRLLDFHNFLIFMIFFLYYSIGL